MIRFLALWLVGMAALILLVILREEWLSSRGKVPLGRLRQLWFRPERRRAPRFRVNWMVRYQRVPGTGRLNGKPRDVSSTGAGLVTQERLSAGQELRVELSLPKEPEPISVAARVVWCREIQSRDRDGPSPRHFLIGIQFNPEDAAAQGLIAKALGTAAPAAKTEQPLPEQARAYARWKRRLWLADTAILPLFLCGIIFTGSARSLGSWIAARLSPWPVQVAVYVGTLWLCLELLTLPLTWLSSFALEHRFGLSTQGFSRWVREYAKKLLLGGVIGLGVVLAFSGLIRSAPSTWWIWAVMLWAIWSAFLTWIGPTLLIPLFYRQSPLKDSTLQDRLEEFVRRCGTPVRGIFELNLSATTRKANACLCGLGNSRRVLVSDTLLSTHSPDEVEVVLAHELGHHRLHHVGILILTSAAAAGVGCFAIDRAIRLLSPPLGLTGLTDLAALPVMALGFFTVGLALMPLIQGISRRLEDRADRFALERTRNPAAFVSTMRRLAAQNLAELDPPRWAEWLLYDHPPIGKRIALAERAAQRRGMTP